MSEDKITPQDIALLEQALPHLKDEQKVRALQKLRVYKKNWVQKHGKDTFLDFIQHVYPVISSGSSLGNLTNPPCR